MNDRKLSATDSALRQRITKLSVHIPCGGLRGPLGARWQSCWDEDSPEKWEGCDVSHETDLCIICFKGTAGGTSRWSWLACKDCLAVNNALEWAWGYRPLALGRHSLMNGIGVRGDAPPEVRERQLARLVEFARGDRLRDWRTQEYRRLADVFDPLADVPLTVWQARHSPSRPASVDAFERLLGTTLPERTRAMLGGNPQFVFRKPPDSVADPRNHLAEREQRLKAAEARGWSDDRQSPP